MTSPVTEAGGPAFFSISAAETSGVKAARVRAKAKTERIFMRKFLQVKSLDGDHSLSHRECGGEAKVTTRPGNELFWTRQELFWLGAELFQVRKDLFRVGPEHFQSGKELFQAGAE